MLILGFPELHLVGGSGPHEGNILVGGRPVCDDGHNAQNALVVCRFPFYLGAMISNKPLKIMITSKNSKFDHPGCWATPPASQPTGRTSARWRPTSRWTTCSALAMRPLSLTVPISRCVTLITKVWCHLWPVYDKSPNVKNPQLQLLGFWTVKNLNFVNIVFQQIRIYQFGLQHSPKSAYSKSCPLLLGVFFGGFSVKIDFPAKRSTFAYSMSNTFWAS